MPITTAQELRDALRAAQPGDTLTLAPGIYALPTALACDRDLTLTGDAHLGLHTTGPLIHHTAGRLTLNGLTFSRSGPGHGPLIESSGGQIRLDQCRLRGNPTHINRDSTGVHLSRLAWLVGTQSHVEGFGVGVRLEDDARAELADWTLVRNHYGLKLHAHSQGNLDRCTIGRSTSDGIAVSGEAVARLRHNRCTSNNHSAIAFRGRSSGLVVGNSCVRGMWGIHVGGHASPVLRNNTCAHNRMSGIHYSGHAGGVARGNTCHRNKVGLEVEGHASPALHDNQIVDNDTDPTTALTSSTRQLPAPHSTTVPAHAPRHLQHLPTPPASTIATIAVLAATTLAILLPSLGWALIGMATAWAIYIALGLGHWFGLSWLMRHGRTQRATITHCNIVQRRITLTWEDPWGHTQVRTLRARDRETATHHPQGTAVDLIMAPAPFSWLVVVPSLLGAQFVSPPQAPDHRPTALLGTDTSSPPALTPHTLVAYAAPPLQSVWPHWWSPPPIGQLHIDAQGVRWKGANGVQTSLRWERTLTAHLSVWLIDAHMAEVTLTLREVADSIAGHGHGSGTIAIRAQIPQTDISAAVPLQQTRAPYVEATALYAAWPSICVGVRIGGGEVMDGLRCHHKG